MMRVPALSPGTTGSVAVTTGSDARRVLAGSAWVLGGRLLLGTSLLLQSVVLARLLGPRDLGIFLLIQSIVLPASICAVFGLDLLAMRELRDPRSATNAVSPLSFLARGSALIAVAAALTALLILAAIGMGCGLLRTQGCILSPDLVWVLWPLIALTALQLLLSGILRAVGRMAAATFLAGVLSTSLVLGATTIALVLRLDLSLWSVLILQNSALAVAAVASVGFLHGIEHAGRGGVAPVRQFIRTGPLLLATQLLALLVTQSDIWILGLVATPEDIAPYGVAARLAQLVSLPHLVLNGVLPPLMAARVRDRQHGPLERVIRLSVAAATVPAVGLALLFFAWGEGILAVSFGSIYRDAAPILAVLAAANVVNVVCGPCSQLLIMSGHQRTLNLITLVNCVFCLGAGTLAALHVGALGVASVYALGLTMQGIAGAWAAERLVGIKTYAGPMALGDAVAAVQRTIRDAR